MGEPPTPGARTTLAAGRYTLDGVLGRGGIATVWRAYDHRLGVWRALKILEATASPELRVRLVSEARVMAGLRHHHVLPVHDVVEEGGRVYLVAELAAGGSLADRVARAGRLSPGTALRVVEAVLEGLDAAHRSGVVHRDVKPGNVLLTRDGVPMVGDFGIARIGHGRHTAVGTAFGSPAFMAPEQQWDAARADARADVFGAAATLWSLITGQPPWDVSRERADDWVPVGVPAAIGAVIERATRPDPGDRHPTAEALLDVVRSLLPAFPPDPGEPPLVPPDLPTLPSPPAADRGSLTYDLSTSLASPTTPLPTARAPRRWPAAIAAAAGLAGIAVVAWWSTGRSPPPADWRVVPVPYADGRRFLRDGSTVTLAGGQLVRADPAGRETRTPCAAGDVVDAVSGPTGPRLLVRGPSGDQELDGDCRVLRSVAADEEEVERVLDPAGGWWSVHDGLLAHVPADGTTRRLDGDARIAASPDGEGLAWQVLANASLTASRGDAPPVEVARDERLVQIYGIVTTAFLTDEALVYARARGSGRTEIVLQALATGPGGALPALAVIATLDSAPVVRLEPTPGGLAVGSLGIDYDIDERTADGAVAPLVRGPGADRPGAYGPDGTFAYTSDAHGTWDVWAVRDGGAPEVLVGGPDHDTRPTWSGSTLLWLRVEPTRTSVVARAADGRERTLLVQPIGPPSAAHLPPPSDLQLACTDQGCVLCRAAEDRVIVSTLDPTTGQIAAVGSFAYTTAQVASNTVCAIAPGGRAVVLEEPANVASIGRDAVSSHPTPFDVLQSIQVLADGTELLTGRIGGDFAVALRSADGSVRELARGPNWLAHARATPDGARIAWLATRETPATFLLTEP